MDVAPRAARIHLRGGFDLLWPGLGVLAALLIAGSAALVDRAQITAHEAYDGLVHTRYDQRVPPGYRLMGAGHGSAPSEGAVASVGVHFVEKEKSPGYRGTPAMVNYEIWPTPAQANEALDDYLAALRASTGVRNPFRFFHLRNSALPNFCVRDITETAYCQVVLANVRMDALSRIRLLRLSDRSYVFLLARSGVAHLRRALGS